MAHPESATATWTDAPTMAEPLYGIPRLDEFTHWRLKHGEIGAFALLREVMDTVAADRPRTVEYTLARQDGTFAIHLRDPPINQGRAIREHLDNFYGLDVEQDGDTLTVPQARFEATVDALAGEADI